MRPLMCILDLLQQAIRAASQLLPPRPSTQASGVVGQQSFQGAQWAQKESDPFQGCTGARKYFTNQSYDEGLIRALQGH